MENKNLIRRLYEDCINPGKLEVLEELIHPEYVGPSGKPGPSGYAETIVPVRTGFPDVQFTIRDIVTENDRVAVQWEMNGTHQGSFNGFRPSGRKVTQTALVLFQIKDGKIYRTWVQPDRLGVLQQIGALPEMKALLQNSAGHRKIALVLGSAREERFCDTISKWVQEQLASRSDLTYEIIDPAKLKLKGDYQIERNEAYQSIQKSLEQADAYIVITPEYNHGYPAPLKVLIDNFYVEWRGKAVAFVSYGGISGGIRAVEQLRQVFNELHTVSIRENVCFANAQSLFDVEGRLHSPGGPVSSMDRLTQQLLWWSDALRTARASAPYKA
jgi:NAD(P)H-dependent FMN reductase/predicted ester cyclase